jgi:hypothetical protein
MSRTDTYRYIDGFFFADIFAEKNRSFYSKGVTCSVEQHEILQNCLEKQSANEEGYLSSLEESHRQTCNCTECSN